MRSNEKPKGPVERGPRPVRDLNGLFSLTHLVEGSVKWSLQEELDSAYAGYSMEADGVYRKVEEEQPRVSRA